MTIYYNAETNAFYDSEINSIPENSIEISRDLHIELLQKQADGLVIVPGKNGEPAVIERVITDDEKMQANRSKKMRLMGEADREICVLEDILELGMQEADEAAQLKTWKKYRIQLRRVDVSDINAKFPDKPK